MWLPVRKAGTKACPYAGMSCTLYLLTKLIFTSTRGPAYRLMQWVGVAKGDRAPLKRRIVVDRRHVDSAFGFCCHF
jgi:hypothetical protein